MQACTCYKSLTPVALPICKFKTHVCFQDGKFEGFPFNFNFRTFHFKQTKVVKAEENRLHKYYCELKTLWIKFPLSLFPDLALMCRFETIALIFYYAPFISAYGKLIKCSLETQREFSILFHFGTKIFHKCWGFTCFIIQSFIYLL